MDKTKQGLKKYLIFGFWLGQTGLREKEKRREEEEGREEEEECKKSKGMDYMEFCMELVRICMDTCLEVLNTSFCVESLFGINL